MRIIPLETHSNPNRKMPPHFIKRRHLYISIDQTGSSATLMPKNIISEHASTIVVISGAAIIAGSMCKAFASSGSIPPITLAMITVHIIVSDTTRAIIQSPY